MIDKLISKIIDKRNPTAVGLDTRLEYVPQTLREKYQNGENISFEGAAGAILEFNKKIIDAVWDLVPAVKIQIAYYELYGLPGLKAFYDTIAYARSKDLIIIGDVKRNDIGATAAAYSSAYIGRTDLLDNKLRAFEIDFATVNPYFGSDGIDPFVDDCTKYNNGIFILVKTSNSSSGEIQDLMVCEDRIYEIIADKVSFWGRELIGYYGYSAVGAVVGATYPSQGESLRKRMPHTFFLVPGYGAQGGGADDIIGCFDDKGLGAVINASRSIICAYNRKPWKGKYLESAFDEAARSEVLKMKKDIDEGLSQKGTRPW